MYYLNKVVWGMANPTLVAWAIIVSGLIMSLMGVSPRKKLRGLWLVFGGIVLMWIWMMPLTTRMLGLPLEREWLIDGRVPCVESFPESDAVILMGGSMGVKTNVSDYAEMGGVSDRVWQTVRLWRDQVKRRGEKRLNTEVKIIVSGRGNELTTKELLVDFGVPTNALVFLDEPRNTEQEAREIARLLGCSKRLVSDMFSPHNTNSKPRVLLVTSAWHMRRAKLMFEKYAPDIETVPSPGDFESTTLFADGFDWSEFLPSGQCVGVNERCFHEWLGYWGYKLLR